MLHAAEVGLIPSQSGTERAPRPTSLTWWLIRASIIPAVFTAALLIFTAVAGDAPASEISTLVGRIVSGLLVSALVLAILVALARRVDRRSLHEAGIPWTGRAGLAFTVGVVAWLVPALGMFAILGVLGTPLTVAASAPEFVRVLLLLTLAVLFMEAVPEELVLRGYLTTVLGERLGDFWVIAVQTSVFTVVALLLRGSLGVEDLSLFVGMGVGLGYMRLVTGSVWTGVGFHLAFQTGSQLVLTHNVTDFEGSTTLSMLALGAVPFGVGTMLIAGLVSVRPGLLDQRAALPA